MGDRCSLLEQELERSRPDLVLTYGGDWLAREVIGRVQGWGLPVVFWLRNLAYREADLFRGLHGVLVASRFVQEH